MVAVVVVRHVHRDVAVANHSSQPLRSSSDPPSDGRRIFDVPVDPQFQEVSSFCWNWTKAVAITFPLE